MVEKWVSIQKLRYMCKIMFVHESHFSVLGLNSFSTSLPVNNCHVTIRCTPIHGQYYTRTCTCIHVKSYTVGSTNLSATGLLAFLASVRNLFSPNGSSSVSFSNWTGPSLVYRSLVRSRELSVWNKPEHRAILQRVMFESSSRCMFSCKQCSAKGGFQTHG